MTSVREVRANLAMIAQDTEDKKLNLDEIYFNPELNCRDDYWGEDADPEKNRDAIENLMMSIETTGGITNPMQVVEVDPTDATDGLSYVLTAGFRRYSALKRLSENEDESEYAELFGTQQPCRVMPTESEAEMSILQLTENLQRKDLNAMEESNAINGILDSIEGLKPAVLSKMLGISPSYISQYIKMKQLPDAVKDMVSAGDLPFSHVRDILYHVKEESWIEAAKVGATLTYGKFNKLIEKRYKQDKEVTDEDVQKVKDGDELDDDNSSDQREAKIRRATDLKKIRPFIKDKAENSDDDKVKAKWRIRLDALDYVLSNSETKMEKDVEPFIKELEKKEKEEEENKEATAAKKSFIKDCIKRIRTLRKTMPADGEKKNTLKEDFMVVNKHIVETHKKWSKEEDEEKKKKILGFEIDIETFLKEELVPAWHAEVEKQKESKKKREEAKKKKEEEAKEEEAKKKEEEAKKGKVNDSEDKGDKTDEKTDEE